MAKQSIKEIIKKYIIKVFSKMPGARRFVSRLNKLIDSSELAEECKEVKESKAVKEPKIVNEPEEKDQGIFTERATYSCSSIDYINSLLLDKEQRAQELKRVFYNNVGYYLDLENPKTFNQKLQWLKLNYYDPQMARAVDKCEFKRYIAEKIGEGYTIPLYGEWEKESQINFDSLPDQFVLKSNVQSDGRHIIVVKDKNNLDVDRLRTVMASWLFKKNTLCGSYCCAYKNVKPKILAEKYLSTMDDESLIDYKFMCFNGKAEMLFVVLDRGSNMSLNFYDMNWNMLPFTRKYPNSTYEIKPPKNFEKMKEIANKLAEPFPFVRVDFYESADGEQLYVGELTFYPGGGYEKFSPIEWDYKLGQMLHLPEANI